MKLKSLTAGMGLGVVMGLLNSAVAQQVDPRDLLTYPSLIAVSECEPPGSITFDSYDETAFKLGESPIDDPKAPKELLDAAAQAYNQCVVQGAGRAYTAGEAIGYGVEYKKFCFTTCLLTRVQVDDLNWKTCDSGRQGPVVREHPIYLYVHDRREEWIGQPSPLHPLGWDPLVDPIPPENQNICGIGPYEWDGHLRPLGYWGQSGCFALSRQIRSGKVNAHILNCGSECEDGICKSFDDFNYDYEERTFTSCLREHTIDPPLACPQTYKILFNPEEIKSTEHKVVNSIPVCPYYQAEVIADPSILYSNVCDPFASGVPAKPFSPMPDALFYFSCWIQTGTCLD